jgi:glycerol-3-phosphate O-acyltransferase
LAYKGEKILRNTLEGLWVNQTGIENLKKLIKDGEHVILIPTYKSFTDLFILQYTFLHHQIQLPFTLGNFEDTPRVYLIDKILKKMGYILIKRSRN